MPRTLLELLVNAGALTPRQADTARRRMARMAQPAETVLLELKFVPEATIYDMLARQQGVPLIDLDALPAEAPAPDRLPDRLALQFQCFPILDHDGALTLAFAHLPDATATGQLQLLLGGPFRTALARPSQLERRLQAIYGLGADSLARRAPAAREGTPPTAAAASEGTISALVTQILSEAVASRATDIHLEPYRNELRLRFRVDGMLRAIPTPPAMSGLADAIVSRIKVMAQLNIAERRLPQDGRIRFEHQGRSLDFRVSSLPTPFGESLCLRLLDAGNLLLELGRLGLDDAQLTLLRTILQRPNGLILVTGPTGSGKTTTLYSILAHLRDQRPELKIITVEDPVEYEVAGITQIQTHAEIGLSFASALRSILRHDPDILLIGEIRDRETASIAIQSALTGHLVFSTLHTNDSVGAVNRLINMGLDPDLVASSLTCVIAQRLIRRLCPHCAIPSDPLPPDLARELAAALQKAGRPAPTRLLAPRPGGCAACGHTGYHGRIAIYEFLILTEALEDRIAARIPDTELRALAREGGMRTFREDAWLKAAQGITSPAEVLRVTASKKQS